VVGDSLNPVVDAIRRHDGIDWVQVRHEEAGAFAAGAEAQLTGRLVACAGSCGPGNLHLINGLDDAHRSMAPVLALAAQIPSTEIGTGYFQETHPPCRSRSAATTASSSPGPSSWPGSPRSRSSTRLAAAGWGSSPSPETWPTRRPAAPTWSTPTAAPRLEDSGPGSGCS
jgi:hypothetical protein